jgi:DNA-binding transcriptional LysR family regulator
MKKNTQHVTDHYLRSFIRIARAGSLHKAAAIVGISQPALSKQMNSLEETLGVSLFRRTTRGMSLTAHGEFLLNRVQSHFDDIDDSIMELDSRSPKLKGQIVFGAIETCSFIDTLWDLVGTFSLENPELSVNIRTYNSAEIVRQVSTGEFDFGIVHDNSLFPGDMIKSQLVRERLSIVYSRKHFDDEAIARYPDLDKNVSLISFDVMSALGRLVQNHNRRYGIPIRIETNSVRYLLDATARGLGITILPERFPLSSFQDAGLARLNSPALDTVRGNLIIQRRRPSLSNQAERFVSELLRKIAT